MFQLSADLRSRRPLKEVEQPANPPAAPHAAHPVVYRHGRDESIVETLMIPLAMIVRDELRDGVSKMPLADGNDPIETFLLDRPDESLGVGVRVGRALGDPHHADLPEGRPAHPVRTGGQPAAIVVSQEQPPVPSWRRRSRFSSIR